MIAIEPSGRILGCTLRGLDMSKPLEDRDLGAVVLALAKHGYVRFPDQTLSTADVKTLSDQFGEVQMPSNADDEREVPGVGFLSNMVVDGKPLGKPDAGLMWHTEMSYNKPFGYVNVLYAVKVPQRDGKALGPTEFIDGRAAYDDLPDAVKRRLKGLTATHDVQNYWDAARDMGSSRPPFTPEHRAAKPLVSHPLAMVHPVSGRTVLYCNPGFTVRIDGLPEAEGRELLKYLIDHQMQPKYRCAFAWAERDLLIWDNIGTMHRAVCDYGPDEHRWIKRCQVKATKILDPAFLRRVVHPESVSS